MEEANLVSVCIATYNDENTIEGIIRESLDVFSNLKLDCEIIVIDDCSSDKTAKILDSLKSSLRPLKVINHRANKGYGITIKELLYSSTGDFIFTLPGDLQIPPRVIREMLPHIKTYDIVIGVRKPRNDPLFRKINSTIYNTMINMLFDIGITDINSTKLIKRRVIDNLKLISDGPFIDAELCAKAIKKGYKIKEVNVEHRHRIFGVPSGDKISVMWKAFRETLSMIGRI